jgi:hypothetical protein
VTCYTQPRKPCKCTYILDYLPQGDESSPRGGWGIGASALPEVLTFFYCCVFHIDVVWRTVVSMSVAAKERQYGAKCQKDACFVIRSMPLFKVLVMN